MRAMRPLISLLVFWCASTNKPAHLWVCESSDRRHGDMDDGDDATDDDHDDDDDDTDDDHDDDIDDDNDHDS